MDLIAALRTFLRVAEVGSFSAVAEERGVTQPAVSRQVSALEEHFGTRLVQRSTHAVTLTEEGRELVPAAQQLVERCSSTGGGSEVFLVKNDNHVAAQAVRIGSLQDGQWFVTDGLKAGDRVVVEGFQKFVAGDKVRPQAWTEADASADAAPQLKPTTTAQR